MKSLKLYKLPCGCIERVEYEEFSEMWKCANRECGAEIHIHQLREWPKDKNGNELPRPKDKAIRTLP